MFVEKLNDLNIEHLATLMEKALVPTKTIEELIILSCSKVYGRLNLEVGVKFVGENTLNYDKFSLTDCKCYLNDRSNMSATEVMRKYLSARFNEYDKVLEYYVDNNLNM